MRNDIFKIARECVYNARLVQEGVLLCFDRKRRQYLKAVRILLESASVQGLLRPLGTELSDAKLKLDKIEFHIESTSPSLE